MPLRRRRGWEKIVAKFSFQNETGSNVKIGKMGKIGKRKNIESRRGAEAPRQIPIERIGVGMVCGGIVVN